MYVYIIHNIYIYIYAPRRSGAVNAFYNSYNPDILRHNELAPSSFSAI